MNMNEVTKTYELNCPNCFVFIQEYKLLHTELFFAPLLRVLHHPIRNIVNKTHNRISVFVDVVINIAK